MWHAHQTSTSETDLEDVTAGIIFLGTPHTTSDDDKSWEKWRWILKAGRKDIPKQSQTDDDIKMLSELCRNFENLNLQIPVLSVFETEPTKVRDNLIQMIRGGRGKSVVGVSPCILKGRPITGSVSQLVDESLCRIGFKYEQTFGATSDHNNLYIIDV